MLTSAIYGLYFSQFSLKFDCRPAAAGIGPRPLLPPANARSAQVVGLLYQQSRTSRRPSRELLLQPRRQKKNVYDAIQRHRRLSIEAVIVTFPCLQRYERSGLPSSGSYWQGSTGGTYAGMARWPYNHRSTVTAPGCSKIGQKCPFWKEPCV